MYTVVETPTFLRRANKLLSKREHDDLIEFLARNPEAGDLISETGGIRKVRFAGRSKGKRGGFRS